MDPKDTDSATARRHEDGFTLMEVLIAVVVLVFGLMAVVNLFVVATGTNVAARHMTAAAAQATEVMELVKAVPFAGLVPGGGVDLDTPAAAGHIWGPSQSIDVDLNNDGTIDVYEADRAVEGVGTIRVRWQIVRIDGQTRLVRIVAGSASGLLRARSRVEFLTYRSCTGPDTGCPASPSAP